VLLIVGGLIDYLKSSRQAATPFALFAAGKHFCFGPVLLHSARCLNRRAIVHAIQRIRHYDRVIQEFKRQHSRLCSPAGLT